MRRGAKCLLLWESPDAMGSWMSNTSHESWVHVCCVLTLSDWLLIISAGFLQADHSYMGPSFVSVLLPLYVLSSLFLLTVLLTAPPRLCLSQSLAFVLACSWSSPFPQSPTGSLQLCSCTWYVGAVSITAQTDAGNLGPKTLSNCRKFKTYLQYVSL